MRASPKTEDTVTPLGRTILTNNGLGTISFPTLTFFTNTFPIQACVNIRIWPRLLPSTSSAHYANEWTEDVDFINVNILT